MFEDNIIDSHFGRIAQKLDAKGYRNVDANNFIDTYLVGKKVYVVSSIDLDNIGCGMIYIVESGVITGMIIRDDTVNLLITFDSNKKEFDLSSSEIGETIFFTEEEAKAQAKAFDERREANIRAYIASLK